MVAVIVEATHRLYWLLDFAPTTGADKPALEMMTRSLIPNISFLNKPVLILLLGRSHGNPPKEEREEGTKRATHYGEINPSRLLPMPWNAIPQDKNAPEDSS